MYKIVSLKHAQRHAQRQAQKHAQTLNTVSATVFATGLQELLEMGLFKTPVSCKHFLQHLGLACMLQQNPSLGYISVSQELIIMGKEFLGWSLTAEESMYDQIPYKQINVFKEIGNGLWLSHLWDSVVNVVRSCLRTGFFGKPTLWSMFETTAFLAAPTVAERVADSMMKRIPAGMREAALPWVRQLSYVFLTVGIPKIDSDQDRIMIQFPSLTNDSSWVVSYHDNHALVRSEESILLESKQADSQAVANELVSQKTREVADVIQGFSEDEIFLTDLTPPSPEVDLMICFRHHDSAECVRLSLWAQRISWDQIRLPWSVLDQLQPEDVLPSANWQESRGQALGLHPREEASVLSFIRSGYYDKIATHKAINALFYEQPILMRLSVADRRRAVTTSICLVSALNRLPKETQTVYRISGTTSDFNGIGRGPLQLGLTVTNSIMGGSLQGYTLSFADLGNSFYELHAHSARITTALVSENLGALMGEAQFIPGTHFNITSIRSIPFDSLSGTVISSESFPIKPMPDFSMVLFKMKMNVPEIPSTVGFAFVLTTQVPEFLDRIRQDSNPLRRTWMFFRSYEAYRMQWVLKHRFALPTDNSELKTICSNSLERDAIACDGAKVSFPSSLVVVKADELPPFGG